MIRFQFLNLVELIVLKMKLLTMDTILNQNHYFHGVHVYYTIEDQNLIHYGIV
jgi:hypothetical protein